MGISSRNSPSIDSRQLTTLRSAARTVGFVVLISIMLLLSSPVIAKPEDRLSSRVAALKSPVPESCNLDFDGNGVTDPLTDGILFTRYLSGYTDAALVGGAIGPGATRTTGADVIAFLAQADCTPMKDVDGDGATDPLTDGVLLMRYLFGFSGLTLTDNALGTTAKRTTDRNIQDWLAFYEQPRYVIIDGTVATGERISDPWEDLVFVGRGPGSSAVRVVEGLNHSGNPMFHWDVSGDVVDLELSNPNLLVDESQRAARNNGMDTREAEDYPTIFQWAYAKAYFSGRGSGGRNRIPMSKTGTTGGVVYNEGVDAAVTMDVAIDEAYRLTSVCNVFDVGCFSNDKDPVLLVHGYTPGSNADGGGESTWGAFPQLLDNTGDYVPFKFHWNTSARFTDVATNLGYVVKSIANSTGKEVHLVAHSFGGLLVRTMLQKQAYGFNQDYSPYIASVVTLGTPHSGIAKENSCMHGTPVPWGQDSSKFLFCDQLSCHQAGEGTLDAADAFYFDVQSDPGELIAALANTTNLLPDVDILTLIGLSTPRDDENEFIDDGDGLITGWGQRFRPSDATGGDCVSTVTEEWNLTLLNGDELPGSSARVTEHILGLGQNAHPGGPNPDTSVRGYRHNKVSLVGHDVTPEVNIECGIGGICEGNEGYWQTRIWLRDHPSGPVTQNSSLPITLRTVDPLGNPVGNLQVTVFQSNGAGNMLASGLTGATSGEIMLNVPFEPNHRYGILITISNIYHSQQQTIQTGVTIGLSPEAAMGDITLVPEDATPGVLSGKVTEGSLGGNALPDVHISVRRTDHTWEDAVYETDVSGLWGPFDLVPGAYQIIFSKSAYQTTSTTVTVQPNEPTVANNYLIPGANGLQALNDTGITTCSNGTTNGLPCPVYGYSGQDAEFGRDVTHIDDSDGQAGYSFTKIDANGNPLPPNSTEWSCVQDNVTGLVWEAKTDDGGLHDKDDTYSWYNMDPAINGGDPGYVDDGNICYGYDVGDPATYCNTQAYVARINKAGWCGYNNWRMPTLEELRSILDYSVSLPGPAIDTDYFPNAVNLRLWSSSPRANYSNDAWLLSFGDSHDNPFPKNNNHYVRLVRRKQ